MIFQYKQFIPVVDPTSFVHPQSAVTGCVIIGKNVYVGPFAALRGDFGEIIIEDGGNVQEHCMIHMFPGISVHLEKDVHVGHGAIIHGAKIGSNTLIGMNSVIMDDVVIGKECIIGAMSFIPEGSIIPDRSLVVGNPAKVIKTVTDEMLQWKIKGTLLYQQLANDCLSQLKEVEALSQLPESYPRPTGLYSSWKRK